MADLILDLLVEQSIPLELGVEEQVFLNAEGSYVLIPGPQGPQGIQGVPGTNGTNGTNGIDGVNGIDGNTILYGDVVPDVSLGIDGNYYLDNITFSFYQKVSGNWVLLAKITGEDGAPGANGTNGTNGTNGLNGTNGATIITSAGVPSGGTGANLDLYINTTNYDLYQKFSGTWTLIGNIKGATGPTGATGQGVPTGGTAGQVLSKIDGTNYNTQWTTPSGGGSTWEYLVANWSIEPTLNTAISGGEVYNYTLLGVTRYRFIPTTYNPTQDAFYSTFTSGTLSNLIVTRG